ncbi:hypothetical protein FOXYSP1_15478 [Fusarium oxysporum f. sp. phaseoli]
MIDIIEEALAQDKKGKGNILRFLNLEIEELNRLKGKLVREVNLSRRKRKFIKALRLGGLYDKWLEAI